MLHHTGTLLSKQKKQDFRPKDDDVSLTTLQTPVSIETSLLAWSTIGLLAIGLFISLRMAAEGFGYLKRIP